MNETDYPIKQPHDSKMAGNQGWNYYSLTGPWGGNETVEVRCEARRGEDERNHTENISVPCTPSFTGS